MLHCFRHGCELHYWKRSDQYKKLRLLTDINKESNDDQIYAAEPKPNNKCPKGRHSVEVVHNWYQHT